MTGQEVIIVGQTISNETHIGGNTAERVGGVIQGIGENLKSISSVIKFNEDSEFYICDRQGNVIFKVDSDGVHTTNANIKSFIRNDGDELIVADRQGNVIFKVDSDGIYTTNVNVKSLIRNDGDELIVTNGQGNVIFKVDSDGINTKNVNIESSLNNNDNELIVTDGQGNIIAKINKDGFKAVKVVAREFALEDGKPLGTQYADFDLYIVGDSFSAGNYWNVKCAEILGCNFDAEANIKAGLNISTGGSSTGGGGLSSAFFRVKNLYDQNIVKNDGENAIIILQNVNDINGGVTGTIDDVPLIPKTPIETNTQVEDFSSSTLAAIPVNKRELSACLTLLVSSMGTRLTISSLPTREGNVTIMTGWGGVGRQYYNIHVVPQATTTETMSYCLARILEYNYTGVNVIDGGDGQSVIFSAGVSSPYYTFLEFYDTDNTGMTCTKSETDSVPAYIQRTRFYIGETLNDADWNNVSNWVAGSYLNSYRAWKSCIEYLMNRFPKAHVMITGFPNFKCVHGDYLRYDGMPDQDAFYNSEIMTKNRAFFSFLKEIAAYYNIPYIGVGEECGIDIMNISTFYPSNDIHPNQNGFERMARYVAREIQKYV